MTLLVGKRSQSINYLLFSFRKSYPAQVKKKPRKYPRRWHLTIVKCCLGYIRIFSNVPVDIYITSIFCNFLIETWFWSYPNSRGRCNFIIWLKSMRRPKMIFFSKTFTLLVASVWLWSTSTLHKLKEPFYFENCISDALFSKKIF